ncbi:MAG: GNAT family N-acetyltransferase, partial [Bacteroidales bacterium]
NSDSFPAFGHATARNNFELDLSVGYDQIVRHYASNLVRNLRKSEDAALQVSPHPDINMIISIFRANRGATLPRWNDQTYQRLRRLYHSLEHRGQARAWGIYNATNELVAGAVFFFDLKHAIMIFSGITPDGRETGAMPRLIDHVIKEFASTPLILDFEGSMDPGLARFYGSFGAEIRQYWFWKMNRLPIPFKWMR